MTYGVYFDGQRARTRQVELNLREGLLCGSGEDVAFEWPVEGLRLIDETHERVRLAPPGDGVERLVVERPQWRAMDIRLTTAVADRARRNHWKLVGVLAAAGVTATLAVFVGIPAAAGPLTRVTPPRMEARIGTNIEHQLTLAMKPCDEDSPGAWRLQELGNELAANSTTPFKIRVRAVHAPMVNAFALPGGSILVTDGMIDAARTPDELAGVLAHEIAHVEKRHAMLAAWRSMGVGLVLDAVVGGGTGAGQQAVLLAGGLTQQRFSRKLEAEADARAVELLKADNVSTKGMADLFERMAGERPNKAARNVAEWFSTHPDTLRRAERLRAASRAGLPPMSPRSWRQLKEVCVQPDSE